MKYIDATNVVKLADATLVEIDRLWQGLNEPRVQPKRDEQALKSANLKKQVGRIEGLAMAMSLIAGGDEDANQTAEPNPD